MPGEFTGQMKRSGVILPIALVAVGIVALCYGLEKHPGTSAELTDLLELAPPDSTFIAYADVAALRESPLIQELASLAQPASVDRDYAEFVRATGFDYQRDLDRVVLAARSSGPAGQTLAFADGRFNREKIAQYALRSGKIENENGRSVYVMPSATPGKNVSLAFLSGTRMILSDGGSLSAVSGGPFSAGLEPALRERLSRVSGAPLFIVAKTPGVAAAGTTAAGASAVFESLRWLDFAVRPDGGEVILSAEGECDSPDQAQKVASALEFVRGLLRTGLTDPKARGRMPAATAAAAEHLLQAASVTTAADRVRLLVTVTPDMLAIPTSHSSSAR